MVKWGVPVLPIVAVVLKFLVASPPGCDEMIPFVGIESVELVLPDKCIC